MNNYLRLVAYPMHPRFQFRKSRSQQEGEQGIVQVTLCFTRYKQKKADEYGPYSTPIETTRTAWEDRRSIRPNQAIKELNRQISNYQATLEEAHAQLERELKEQDFQGLMDGPMVMDALNRLRLGGFSPISLAEIYGQFYASKQSVVERNRKIRKKGQISEGTLKTYPKRWVLIQQFLIYKKTPKLPVVSIGFRFATELKEWMLRQHRSRGVIKPYDPATIHKVIGLLKMLLTYAQSKEYIRTNPLATFTTESGSEADPKPLTESQMQHLENCELPPTLRYQCDSWLVAAELCLHYSDYVELPTMKFIRSESGTLMIQNERVKQTGTRILQTVNVTPRASRLINKYGGVKHLYYTSGAYFSKILKKVARLAGLNNERGEIMPLAFGQGRDTGLTARAIQGANNTQLSRMGGWTDAKEADKYINAAAEIVDTFARNLPPPDHLI